MLVPPPHPISKWLVSTDWLAANLGAPDLVVLDASYYLPGMPHDPSSDYAAGHIPGAVRFDIDQIADHTIDLPHMLPAPDDFAKAAGALGIGERDTIVVYDDGAGVFSSPRVWFTFRLFGAEKVFVLDGRLTKWRAENRPMERGSVRRDPKMFVPRPRRDAVASLDRVRQALATQSAQVVDARPADRFRGEAAEPRAEVRSGHMPGSHNVPASAVFRDGKLLPHAQLRQIFTAAGVDLDRPVITSCGSGVTAAILWLALDAIGKEPVALYDGSWSEWGSRPDLPAAIGPA